MWPLNARIFKSTTRSPYLSPLMSRRGNCNFETKGRFSQTNDFFLLNLGLWIFYDLPGVYLDDDSPPPRGRADIIASVFSGNSNVSSNYASQSNKSSSVRTCTAFWSRGQFGINMESFESFLSIPLGRGARARRRLRAEGPEIDTAVGQWVFRPLVPRGFYRFFIWSARHSLIVLEKKAISRLI